jgi:hypothetical protein
MSGKMPIDLDGRQFAPEQEVNAIRMKSTKSRSFIVEGM